MTGCVVATVIVVIIVVVTMATVAKPILKQLQHLQRELSNKKIQELSFIETITHLVVIPFSCSFPFTQYGEICRSFPIKCLRIWIHVVLQQQSNNVCIATSESVLSVHGMCEQRGQKVWE